GDSHEGRGTCHGALPPPGIGGQSSRRLPDLRPAWRGRPLAAHSGSTRIEHGDLQPMNFPESSLANLSSLGYTEDEARFVYLVATHSGDFSMRQFLQFTGTKSGDKSMAFSQKLLGKGHATARSFLRNGLVYHLFSRIVYRA